MYYEEFPLEANHSPIKLKEWMEKVKEIQVHYDMNYEPKMLIEKLQMLVYMCVSPKQKLVWFK
jgi:hypothetical protein